jgi:predicted outer membrane repeat protein
MTDTIVTHNSRGIRVAGSGASHPTIVLDGVQANRNENEGLLVTPDGTDSPQGSDVDIANSTFNWNNSGIRVVDEGSTLDLIVSAVYGNRGPDGAGLYLGNQIGASIDGSTIALNEAAQQGGGIWNGGDLSIVNSTLSQNTARAEGDAAPKGGGGIFNAAGGTVDLEYVTMFRNQTSFQERDLPTRAYGEGEAIYNDGASAQVEVTATIIALEITHTPTADDDLGRENCGGNDPVSHGDNIEDMDTCNFQTAENDLVNTDPNLFSLTQGGGETESHIPEPGSPAIDHDDTCSKSVDQRGLSRPFPDDCDTGSVEVQGTDHIRDCPQDTICVNNEFDHVPDGCTEADCTLREAVIAANADPDPDIVFLPSEDYFLTQDGTGEDSSLTGDLDITGTLTILGEVDGGRGPDDVEENDEGLSWGEPISVIDATFLEGLKEVPLLDTPPDRALHVPGGDSELTLSGVVIQHGRVEEPTVPDSTVNYGGGGVLVDDASSSLAIGDSWVMDNETQVDGGGIYFEGGPASTLFLNNSRVSANEATAGTGGGIAVPGDDASITIRATILGGEAHSAGNFVSSENVGFGNTAAAGGGGISIGGERTSLNAERSEIHNNFAGLPGGGGIAITGPNAAAALTDTAVTENETNGGGDDRPDGGAVYLGAGDITLSMDTSSEPELPNQLSGNYADGDGGAIDMHVANQTVTLDGTEVHANRGNDGGVVAGPDFDPGGCDFICPPGPPPPPSGGGPARLIISGASVLRNWAEGEAGVVYTNSATTADIDVDDVTFEENRALVEESGNTFGGGVFNTGAGTLDVIGSDFISNSSEEHAGAVYLDKAVATFEDTSFEHNHAAANGGAIFADDRSELSVTETDFVDNVAENQGNGGAIYNEGAPASAEDVWFTYNEAGNEGGGVYNAGGDFDFDAVTFSDNRAESNDVPSGGGFYNRGTAAFLNSTFSRNEDATRGGAIYNNSSLTLEFSTIYDHETDLQGDPSQTGPGVSIFNDSGGTMGITATIVANSEGRNCDGSGTTNSGGFNIEDQDTCGFTDGTDLRDTDPELGPLRDNGGFTPTHAPLSDSPAIDHVTSGCPPPSVDQRDVVRPAGATCDSGSVEGAQVINTPPPDDDNNGGGGHHNQPSSPPNGGPEPSASSNPAPSPTSNPGRPPRCADAARRLGLNLITGTKGDDNLRGTKKADVICAKAGDDTVHALAGNDIVWAGAGKDLAVSGKGADTVRGGRGRDVIEGSRGSDEVTAGAGRDFVKGGDGRDRLFGITGNDDLRGGLGPDALYGDGGRDNCVGGPGSDSEHGCET